MRIEFRSSYGLEDLEDLEILVGNYINLEALCFTFWENGLELESLVDNSLHKLENFQHLDFETFPEPDSFDFLSRLVKLKSFRLTNTEKSFIEKLENYLRQASKNNLERVFIVLPYLGDDSYLEDLRRICTEKDIEINVSYFFPLTM